MDSIFSLSSDALSLSRAFKSVENWRRVGIKFMWMLFVSCQFINQSIAAREDSQKTFPGVVIEKPISVPGTLLSARYEEVTKLMKEKKWAEATIILKPIVKEKPYFFEATFDLAKSLAFLGRREEAIGILERARERGSKENRELIARRIKVLSRQFLTNDTHQVFQDGMNYLFSKKYTEAEKRFGAAIKSEPNNVEVLVRMSQCLVQKREFDSARLSLKLAKRINRYEPEISLWLGRVYFLSGELKKSVVELKRAYKELRNSELAPVWLAEALVKMGKQGQAKSVLKDDFERESFHLLSIVTLARMNSLSPFEDEGSLWTIKKDLQVALSRFGQYQNFLESEVFVSSLGFTPHTAKEVKNEIQTLLQSVETRIQSIKESKKTSGSERT